MLKHLREYVFKNKKVIFWIFIAYFEWKNWLKTKVKELAHNVPIDIAGITSGGSVFAEEENKQQSIIWRMKDFQTKESSYEKFGPFKNFKLIFSYKIYHVNWRLDIFSNR